MTALAWWWLSFADEEKFLGVVVLQAPDGLTAVKVAHLLGVNPGGEVAVMQLEPKPEQGTLLCLHQNRLLNRSEAEALDAAARELA